MKLHLHKGEIIDSFGKVVDSKDKNEIWSLGQLVNEVNNQLRNKNFKLTSKEFTVIFKSISKKGYYIFKSKTNDGLKYIFVRKKNE